MSVTGRVGEYDKCTVRCQQKPLMWSDEVLTKQRISSLLLSSPLLKRPFAPSAGLRLPCVPIVWHAAGNERAIWGNSAEEMEPHLQVRLSKRCNIFAVWVARCVCASSHCCLVVLLHHETLMTFQALRSVLQSASCTGIPPLQSWGQKGTRSCGTTTCTRTHTRLGLWETSSSWFWSFTTSQREEVF